MIWDIFISHASEDKNDVARPLCQLLERQGLKVWMDEFQIEIGDSLRKKLDEALVHSKFGVVILSPNFFKKDWTQRELGALQSKEFGSSKVILPIWHNISLEEIANYSPMMADRIAASTSDGLDKVVERIIKVVKPDILVLADSKRKYANDFIISESQIRNALNSINTLFEPIAWKKLTPIKDMSLWVHFKTTTILLT